VPSHFTRFDAWIPFHTTGVGPNGKEKTAMSKTKIVLWALRNPWVRGLIIKGLKNRKVRGLAWTVAKRGIRR
jgi:hypothetical protein